jgi:hypothetical protein
VTDGARFIIHAAAGGAFTPAAPHHTAVAPLRWRHFISSGMTEMIGKRGTILQFLVDAR